MKKILLVLGVILATTGMSNASIYDDFTCPTNPYSHTYGLSNLTGANFMVEKIANSIVEKSIKKDSKGKFKIDMQSYNISLLKKGIFKSLTIDGKNTITDGIYVSDIKMKTLCDYNHIEIDNKNNVAIFRENFGMAFALQITQDDLNKTMNDSKYSEMIRRVNGIGNTYKLFNITASSTKIENNKLYYIMKVSVPLLKTKPEIVIETDLKARNGEIALNNTKLVTNILNIDMSKLNKIINYLNPLEFSLSIFDGKQASTQVSEIEIKNNVINIAGLMLIDKDVVVEQ